jgi:hypothetical protein
MCGWQYPLRDTSNHGLDCQVFFYIIPLLEPAPGIKTIRNVMAFAIYPQHVSPLDSPAAILLVDFCLVKCNRDAVPVDLYSLREQLLLRKVASLLPVSTVYILLGHMI